MGDPHNLERGIASGDGPAKPRLLTADAPRSKTNLSPNDLRTVAHPRTPGASGTEATRDGPLESSHDEGCECDECEPLTADDIRYLKAQAIWDDLGLGGL